MSTQKLYCYVDETGQDTKGTLFIVSAVIMGAQRDDVLAVCERIEQESGKMRRKWLHTLPQRRLAYSQRILQDPMFQGNLYVAVYHNDRKQYFPLTIETIAWAIQTHVSAPYRATILIDGLQRSQERQVGTYVRRLGIRTEKVRGIRKEESDALSRLADAVCGLVREAVEGKAEMKQLVEQAKQNGYLILREEQ